jgi:MYXO-CTERM domain-containing protein
MRIITKSSIAAAALLALWQAAPAPAALVIIPNGNFVSPDVPDNTFTDTLQDGPAAVSNWSFFSSDSGTIYSGVWDPTNLDYGGSTGNNAALPGTTGGAGQVGYIALQQFDVLNPLPLGGRLTTTSALPTVGNNLTYTLTVALASSLQFPDYGDVTIQLLVNGDVAADYMVQQGQLTSGTFKDFTTTFTTSPNDFRNGGTLAVGIVHTYGGTNFVTVDFTNVRLDVTPEPASGGVALLSLGAVMLRRQRRSI